MKINGKLLTSKCYVVFNVDIFMLMIIGFIFNFFFFASTSFFYIKRFFSAEMITFCAVITVVGLIGCWLALMLRLVTTKRLRHNDG